MAHVLNFSDVDKLFELVMVLLGFYMLYAFQNVFDSTFYGLGKTNYMLFESVVQIRFTMEERLSFIFAEFGNLRLSA